MRLLGFILAMLPAGGFLFIAQIVINMNYGDNHLDVIQWWTVPLLAIVIYVVLKNAMDYSTCGVCENDINKKHYVIRVNEKRTVVCPTCNTAIKRKMSTAAVKNINI